MPSSENWIRCRTLGRGSTATVSLAASETSGELVAVKSIHLAGDRAAVLQREQRILSVLDSPYVIRYKGFVATAAQFDLYMEFAAGGSLAGRKIDEPAVRILVRDILAGLDYLHSMGLVHCDIKGENLLVGSDGRVKIGDLGCARWVEETGPMRGTPRFMAPETASGKEQGPPADVWALGCAVIEMVTGRPPWADVADPVAVLGRIAFTHESPEVDVCVSGEGRDFLSKCLARDSTKRWSAGELLKHPFIAGAGKQCDLDLSSWVSPKSVLDQGMWEEEEEEEEFSPAERIRELAAAAPPVENWSWDGDWITIRSDEMECSTSRSDEMECSTSRSEEHGFHSANDSDVISGDLDRFSHVDCTRVTEGGIDDVNYTSNSNSIAILGDIVSPRLRWFPFDFLTRGSIVFPVQTGVVRFRNTSLGMVSGSQNCSRTEQLG